jgi:hypothetical protein
MTKTPIERIAEIIATQDVRDPRGALNAIDKIITEDCIEKLNTITNEAMRAEAQRKKTKAAAPHEDEPVFTARVFDRPDSPGSLKCKVVVEFCDDHLEQRHITALNIMMVKFCNEIGV